MGYFIKKDLHGNEGIVIPSGSTANRPASPIEAAMRYNTDTQSLEYFNGTVFVDIAKAGVGETQIDHLATDGLTATFTMTQSQDDADTLMVFINGIYQTPGGPNQYTTSGFDLTFTSIPPSGLQLTVIHGLYDSFVTNSNVFDVPNL